MSDPVKSIDPKIDPADPEPELETVAEQEPGEYPALANADDKDNAAVPVPKSPDEQIEELQKQLEQAQKQLEEAKNRKVVEDARKKVLDAIHGQQAASKLVVDDVTDVSGEWQAKIDDKFTEKDNKAKRDDIKDKIDDAMAAVDDAEKDVNQKRALIIADEQVQKVAEAKLVEQQKRYADAQKELSQFAARIKEAQASIEKLRIEVKNAIDAQDWQRAFGKNYQLQKTITAANQLIDTTKEETRIVNELKRLEDQIKTAQTDAAAAKKKVEDDTAALKAAEAELKEKRDGLASAIGSSL